MGGLVRGVCRGVGSGVAGVVIGATQALMAPDGDNGTLT